MQHIIKYLVNIYMPLSYGQKKGILNVAKQQDPAAFKRFMDAQGLDSNEVYEFGILVKNDMGDDADLVKLENEEGIDLEMGRLGDVVADLAKGNAGGRRRRTRKGGRRSKRTRKGGRRTRRTRKGGRR
jgi:hypothetical protein